MTAFETLAFTPTGATATGPNLADATKGARSIADWAGDTYNVKNFLCADGKRVQGDGVHDDTTGIQACFDAAYGSAASPHGTNYYANHSVMFPNGHYLVSSHANVSITSGTNDGTGKIKLLVSSTTGMSTGQLVSIDGTTGSNNTDGGWVITVDDPTHITLNDSTYDADSTGGTIHFPALTLSNVQGAHIFGAGRFTSTIENTTSGGITIMTNGFEYSKIELLRIKSTGSGSVSLDLDKTTTGFLTVQSNSIEDCFIEGGDIGLRIGHTFGSQGSETTIKNCFVNSCAVAGIQTCNQNACDQTIIGGNIASCDVGIWTKQGQCEVIHGVSFQLNTTWDIKFGIDANSAISIMGCRTESANFLESGASSFSAISCGQVSGSAGIFIECSACPAFHIANCVSLNGSVNGSDGGGDCRGTVQNCQFGLAAALNFSISTANGEVQIFNVRYKGTRETPTAGGPLFISAQQITSAGTKNFVVA